MSLSYETAITLVNAANLRPMTELERSTYFVEAGEPAVIGESGDYFILGNSFGYQLTDEEGEVYAVDLENKTCELI